MGLLYLTPVVFINYFEFFENGFLNIFLNMLFVFVAPIFASLTIMLSVYKFNELKKSVRPEGGLATAGLVSSMFVSTCQNCVPLALYSLGVSYGLFTAYFAPFLLPAKIASIVILSVSFYFASKSVSRYCLIKTRNKNVE